MGKRRKEEEMGEIDESWLVPYADILTLLLALFIVLFAMSSIDAAKFKQLAASLNMAFEGGSGILQEQSQPIEMQNPPASSDESSKMQLDERNQVALMEQQQFEETKKKLDQFIAQNKLDDQLDATITDSGLVFEIKSDALFGSGDSTLLPQAFAIINGVAEALAETDENVVISGHTDDNPINSARFPSNWDLSVQRALNVMKYILAYNRELHPERFSTIGYGQYRPLVPNITDSDRAKNRRVEVLIARRYPIVK